MIDSHYPRCGFCFSPAAVVPRHARRGHGGFEDSATFNYAKADFPDPVFVLPLTEGAKLNRFNLFLHLAAVTGRTRRRLNERSRAVSRAASMVYVILFFPPRSSSGRWVH